MQESLNQQIENITTTLKTLNTIQSTQIQNNLATLPIEPEQVQFVNFLSKLQQYLKDKKNNLKEQMFAEIKCNISLAFDTLLKSARTMNDFNKLQKVLNLIKVKSTNDIAEDEDIFEYNDDEIDSL